jgi:hypothetical protein
MAFKVSICLDNASVCLMTQMHSIKLDVD